MKRTILYYTGISILLLGSTSNSFAQLSQLEFDRPKSAVGAKPANKKLLNDTIQKVLGNSPSKEQEDSRARLQSPAPEASSVAKATEKAPEKIAPIAGQEYFDKEVRFAAEDSNRPKLTPRLKGAFIDKGNESSITSKYAWRKKDGASCAVPASRKDKIRKANAIKEILFRYQGSYDAHDELVKEHCAASCSGDGQSAVIAGLAFDSARGGSFSMTESQGNCSYQLTKSDDGSWKMLEVSKVVCGCINE